MKTKIYTVSCILLLSACFCGCVTVESTRAKLESSDPAQIKAAETDIYKKAVDRELNDGNPAEDERVEYVRLTSNQELLLRIVDDACNRKVRVAAAELVDFSNDGIAYSFVVNSSRRSVFTDADALEGNRDYRKGSAGHILRSRIVSGLTQAEMASIIENEEMGIINGWKKRDYSLRNLIAKRLAKETDSLEVLCQIICNDSRYSDIAETRFLSMLETKSELSSQDVELINKVLMARGGDQTTVGQIFLILREFNKLDILSRETIEELATNAERTDVQIAAIQNLKDVDKAKSIVWNVPVDAELFKGFLESYGTEDVIMELIKSSNRRLLTKEISDIILEHTKSQQVVDAIASLNTSSELKGLGGMRLGVKYNVADRKLLKGLSDIGYYQPDIDYYALSNHKNKLPGFGYYSMFLTPETGTLFRLSAHSESDRLEFGEDGVPTLVRAFEEKYGLQFVKRESSNISEDRTTWSARVGDLIVSVNTSFVGSPVSYSSYHKSWVEMIDESLEKLAKDETARLRIRAEQAKKQADKRALDKAFGDDSGE